MDGDSQGGDGGQDEQDEESIKTISDPNPSTKCKSPEVAEVNKPQSRKKSKASKDKNIEEEATITMDELEQALENSTGMLTKKWSEFAELHLAGLTGIENRVSELKELAAKSAISTATSITISPMQQEIRKWPPRDNQGQLSSAALLPTDVDSWSQMSMTVGIDYTKMSMSKLHLCQLAITKDIHA